MLFSFGQKREILRIAVAAAADRAKGTLRSPRDVAIDITEAAIAAQELLIEKDGTFFERLILSLRKEKLKMVQLR